MPSHDAPWFNDPSFDDNGRSFETQKERDPDTEYERLRERREEEAENDAA
jgi:hypothetical protein